MSYRPTLVSYSTNRTNTCLCTSYLPLQVADQVWTCSSADMTKQAFISSEHKNAELFPAIGAIGLNLDSFSN